MAGFTDQELDDAVSRFVQTTLSIEKSPLGPVDIESKFSETLSFLASTLIYDSNAIFYLIFLTSNQINCNLESIIGKLEDLQQAIREMGKATKPVSKTQFLANAAVSLLSVQSVFQQRGVVVDAAYGQYKIYVDRFINESLKPNIRTDNEIVRPPQLAQTDSISLLDDLRVLYPALLSDVEHLQTILSQFRELNLPLLSLRNSITKVHYDLRDLQSYFESATYTRNEKIAKCREAYLRMISGKNTLENYINVVDPEEPTLTSDQAVGSAIVGNTLETASILIPSYGPWKIEGTNNELKIAEDGNSPTTYILVPDEFPNICGYAMGSLTFVSGSNYFELDERSPFITISPGTWDLSNIVSQINAWFAANGLSSIYEADIWSEGVFPGARSGIRITKTAYGIQKILASLKLTSRVHRDSIAACLAVLGMWEGSYGLSIGLSAKSLADQINVAGKIKAEVITSVIEEGTGGVYQDATHFYLSLNTLRSLDHVGKVLFIPSGRNTGHFKIAAVERTVTKDLITLSSDTPMYEETDSMSWYIIGERVKLSSISQTSSNKLEILNASANSVMGLSPQIVYGRTSAFRAEQSGVPVDFVRLGVKVWDYLYACTGSEIKYTIQDVSSSKLELGSLLPFYPAISDFRIVTQGQEAYRVLIENLESWYLILEQTAPEFLEGIAELERLMNPLLTNLSPSSSQIAMALASATKLKNLLDYVSPMGLSQILVAFIVPSSNRINAALEMFQERGLDRAYDKLLGGYLTEVFSMDKDDAATSSYLLKTMRQLVQKDMPLSKYDEIADDTALRKSYQQTDADYDYSDRDLDEKTQVVGQSAVYNTEEDSKMYSGRGPT